MRTLFPDQAQEGLGRMEKTPQGARFEHETEPA